MWCDFLEQRGLRRWIKEQHGEPKISKGISRWTSSSSFCTANSLLFSFGIGYQQLCWVVQLLIRIVMHYMIDTAAGRVIIEMSSD
jgi:hypothetical protein